MRAALLLAAVLTLTACTSSKETASGGYRISEDENGDVSIMMSEDASPETMMAALMAAADLIKWEPPEAAGGLRQVEASEIPATGDMGTTSVYTYGLSSGRLNVYVYRFAPGADAQIRDTETSLGMMVEQGRIESFEQLARTQRAIPWETGKATLHRVLFSEVKDGQPLDSYMYLMADGVYWIKVRATFPKGAYAADDLDEMVLALLAEDEE